LLFEDFFYQKTTTRFPSVIDETSTFFTTKHYLRTPKLTEMSAIKTHELWTIVHGDDITFKNEEGEQTFKVKSILVSRQRPKTCQIFAEQENAGSVSNNTTVYHGFINAITPNSASTDFEVKAKVGEQIQELNLQSVRSESRECIIS